jgi:hypothetical protein
MGSITINGFLTLSAVTEIRQTNLFRKAGIMRKILLTLLLIATPTLAVAIPSTQQRPIGRGLFTTAELNNLARLDETAPPVRLRRMEYEIADLRAQVGRMKLDRLIDAVVRDKRR